jgi:hypothetical protein
MSGSVALNVFLRFNWEQIDVKICDFSHRKTLINTYLFSKFEACPISIEGVLVRFSKKLGGAFKFADGFGEVSIQPGPRAPLTFGTTEL